MSIDKEYYTRLMKEKPQLSLREAVLISLRHAILTGQLPPDERLMELHLSQEMGVSRTPVREAIRELELEGLVCMNPHRGAYVASITEKEMKDVLEVRRTLESLAVEVAARRMKEEQLNELNKAMLVCENAMKEKNSTKLAEADIQFHNVILDAAGNDKLKLILNNLSDQIYRYRYEFIKEAAHHEAMRLEHRAIYEALKKGDEDRAVSALQYHIDNQAEVILCQIKGE